MDTKIGGVGSGEGGWIPRGEQGNEENMSKLSRIKRQILNWGGFAGGNNQGTTIEQEARCGELIEQNLMNTNREVLCKMKRQKGRELKYQCSCLPLVLPLFTSG